MSSDIETLLETKVGRNLVKTIKLFGNAFMSCVYQHSDLERGALTNTCSPIWSANEHAAVWAHMRLVAMELGNVGLGAHSQITYLPCMRER
jgi:hypothetical protein